MAYNEEQHRNECDRCGKPIPRNQVVQLCKDCDKWLDKYCKEHYSDNDNESEAKKYFTTSHKDSIISSKGGGIICRQKQ